MRYFFHIGYQGTNYSGWQRHPDGLGIQQVIEGKLSQVLKTPINIVGCGRTDAQVHASQFFFHCDIAQTLDFDLVFRLNKLLPNDIAIFDMIPMEGQPHARFDAIERSYEYYIHTRKDPFLSNYSSYYPITNWKLDEMRHAISLLPHYTDYRAFCKMPGRQQNTICKVSSAGLNINEDDGQLKFSISANRFLGKMVRIIVGRLIAIGQGELTVDEFEQCLINPQTSQTIKPAYPQGLYLTKVTYPYLNIPNRSISKFYNSDNAGSDFLLSK